MWLTWIGQHLNQIVPAIAVLAMLILLIRAIRHAVRPKTSPVSKSDLDPLVVDAYPPNAAPIISPAEPRRAQSAVPAPKVASDDGVEFVQLESQHLSKLTIVAQALDNQWESRAMLGHMQNSFKQGRPLGLAEIRDLRYEPGRSEYIRALLNAEQLVVNRVFFYNTDYLAEDYLQLGPARDALMKLMSDGVVVPSLYQESNPAARPPNMDIVTTAHAAWDRLCRDTRVQAVRLSWDDERNKVETKRLSGSFALWLHNLGMFRQFGDPMRLASELGLPTDEATVRALLHRFRDVARWAQNEEDEDRTVVRNGFYSKFIVRDGSDVSKGVIDFDKDFARELKQIADLSYATNLPDVLGGYALTPMDSLPRTALQELTFRQNRQLEPITPEEIKTLLQRQVFDMIQGGLYLKSMSRLTLGDVIALRATDEWAQYISALNGLLANPLGFQEQAQAVYSRYMALARRMTERAALSGAIDLTERWAPVLKLVLTIGSSAITFLWHAPGSAQAAGKVLYSVAGGAINQGATLTARMIIGGIAERQAEAQLETSLDFMRRSLAAANATFKDVTDWLRSQPGFQDISEQRDTSQDEVDPNINTPD